jgi:hypothetical protein
VNTPLDVAPRPSTHPLPASSQDELSLSALLELFEPEEPATVPSPLSLQDCAELLNDSTDRLWAWVRDWSRRAARWGAVAGTPDPVGERSARVSAEVAQ